ncbi:hypothetical protein [Streptomyces sp. NPDC052015]|uniref:alpha/beta fold hydrolase n=1 Tax=Streptomyces sp. NPDC052015 TaxID=3154755 RepID=UPI00341E8693
MPAILVRGVADTHHVWDGVRQHLTRTDVDAWDLPGFGAARPAGFGSSKEEYVDRLIQRLERVGEPVDLVGHDWGLHPDPPRRLGVQGGAELAAELDLAGGVEPAPGDQARRTDPAPTPLPWWPRTGTA